MDIVKLSERVMGMDDATWAKHTNPWSGWTRMSILPLFSFAIWSRIWLGWHVLWLILALLLWTWLNPRLFPIPRNDDAWMTKAILGERLWLAGKIPDAQAHHLAICRNLNLVGGLGVIVLAFGLWRLDPGWTLAGLVTILAAKLWFLDRMVWLRQDMTQGAGATELGG